MRAFCGRETLKCKAKRYQRKYKKCLGRFLRLMALLLFAFFIALPVHSAVACADSSEEAAKEELASAIDELIASLNTDELQEYLDSLSEFEGASLKEKLKNMISGDMRLDYASIGQAVLALVLEEARTMLPAFAVILAVALLCGILNSAKSGFLHSTMSDIIGFVGYISVGAVVLACLVDIISGGFSAVRGMKKQMEIVFPILLTLMAAGGAGSSAAVYRPAVVFMSGAITNLFSTVVMPVALIVIVLSFVGNLSGDVKTEKLGDFFKSVTKWIIGFTLGIFSIFLTVQGISSAQYDGISLRAVKYVISGSVPIVGGFLSGGVEIAIAGSAIIKNALGSFAVCILFATLLKCVLLFAVFQLFLRLSAAVTEPAGDKTSSFLARLAGDSGYFLAGELSVGFLYFLTLLLFILSTGAVA